VHDIRTAIVVANQAFDFLCKSFKICTRLLDKLSSMLIEMALAALASSLGSIV
jgi:hypothetical protein